jgi:hypothetical protein
MSSPPLISLLLLISATSSTSYQPQTNYELQESVWKYARGGNWWQDDESNPHRGEDIATWDTSLITDMAGLLCTNSWDNHVCMCGSGGHCEALKGFNPDLSQWDVSRVRLHHPPTPQDLPLTPPPPPSPFACR